ncbi:MAG: hypothetical protein E7179_03915 [Erysipelotrichaceae bacterium]|jgi:multiple sugar transport system substrate-binding protein|nr:hypothetical protein [Erysipelotrichaceae bacterium]
MKSMKKKFLFLATLSFAAMTAVACGGGGESSPVPSGTSVVPGVSTSIEPVQSSDDKEDYTLPEGDPTREVTIPFWQCLGHEKSANLQNIVDAFNEQYKGKYKVNSVKVAGSYDALADAIKTKLSSGEIPALAMGYPDSFSAYMTNNIDESSIYRLDGFIADKTHGYSETELADFVPEFLNEGKSYQFRGTWSMPMYKSTEIMYYNASYMAGVNPQNKHKFANNAEFNTLATAVENATSKATDEQLKALKDWVVANQGYAYDVPVKWDEMISLARKMVADRAAEGITGEFYPVGYDSDANMLISQFAQRGIPYTVNSAEANEDPELHYVFNNDQAKTFVQEIVDNINDKLLITKALLANKYTNELFTTGQCAMTVGSTGGSSYNVSANFTVRLAPVPYHGDTPKYIQQGPSICFFDNRDPFIHKGAWLFYQAMADGQANAELALANSYDPIRNSSYESESYKQFIAKHADAMKYDIPYHTKDLRQYYMTSPVFPGSDTARVEIGNVLSYAISSKLGVAGALRKAYNICIN